MITPARLASAVMSALFAGIVLGALATSALQPDHSDLAACRQSLSAAIEAAR